jgi:hypothetical protein
MVAVTMGGQAELTIVSYHEQLGMQASLRSSEPQVCEGGWRTNLAKLPQKRTGP